MLTLIALFFFLQIYDEHVANLVLLCELRSLFQSEESFFFGIGVAGSVFILLSNAGLIGLRVACAVFDWLIRYTLFPSLGLRRCYP